MNTPLVMLAALLIIAVLAGGLLKSLATAAYVRLKTLRVPKAAWDGNVTISVWKAAVLAVALALLAVAVTGRGCSLPSWQWSSLTTSGPRAGVLVRESFDDTPQQARMFNDLRSGPAAKYLAEKQHKLAILDDDETGTDGQPLVVLTANGVAGAFPDSQHKPPELLLFADGKMIIKTPIGADATAETVIAAFKANGG